ncbi:MAG: cysteine--tRNA ligase, partial [Gammaproteobacteria bacterium]|nr:cysteine--tRNA ligase [Gammaproteobacteria bacterium]
GILQQDPKAWFEASSSVRVEADIVEKMITARNVARAAKNWSRADAIRDELAQMGVQIKDGPNGTQWRAE